MTNMFLGSYVTGVSERMRWILNRENIKTCQDLLNPQIFRAVEVLSKCKTEQLKGIVY